MTTVGSTLGETAALLDAAGREEPRRRARRLVGAALNLGPSELIGHPEREVSEREQRHINWLVGRTLACEPLSRILGRREFWGLDFALSADTLDPRPDSEAMVEAVLRRIPERDAPLRILDLGTGSGCLLLAVLSELPRAVGVGVDIAAGAAATAKMNAAALGLSGRAVFFVGEWGNALSDEFAIVIANPPYVDHAGLAELPCAVREHDPWRALDGGSDGLDSYRAIAVSMFDRLAPNGLFVTEVGTGQADAVADLFENQGLAIVDVEFDFAGIARCVIGRSTRNEGDPAGEDQKVVGMSDDAV
jgi:release factor glutamine methyltransferase